MPNAKTIANKQTKGNGQLKIENIFTCYYKAINEKLSFSIFTLEHFNNVSLPLYKSVIVTIADSILFNPLASLANPNHHTYVCYGWG